MVEDIDRVAAFLGEKARDDFRQEDHSIFAVSYAFVRLGEAVASLPESLKIAHPENEWRDIKNFRNFMVHVYRAVDPGRLYDTARSHLPELRQKLAQVLVAGR